MAGVLDTARFQALAAPRGRRPGRPGTGARAGQPRRGDGHPALAGHRRRPPAHRGRATGPCSTRSSTGPGGPAPRWSACCAPAAPSWPPARPPPRWCWRWPATPAPCMPAAVLADGAYGIRDVYVGLPARLGRGGVREIVEVDLAPDELTALRAAADRIRERVGTLTPARVRAVVFAGDGRVRVDTVPDPARAGAHRRRRAGAARGRLRHRPAHGRAPHRRARGLRPRPRVRRRDRRARPGVYAPPSGRPGRRSGLHRVRPLLVVPPRRSLGVRRAPVLRHRVGFRARAGRAPRPSWSGCRTPTLSCSPCPTAWVVDAAVFLGDTLATGYAAVQRAAIRPGRHRRRRRRGSGRAAHQPRRAGLRGRNRRARRAGRRAARARRGPGRGGGRRRTTPARSSTGSPTVAAPTR